MVLRVVRGARYVVRGQFITILGLTLARRLSASVTVFLIHTAQRPLSDPVDIDIDVRRRHAQLTVAAAPARKDVGLASVPVGNAGMAH